MNHPRLRRLAPEAEYRAESGPAPASRTGIPTYSNEET